jgi:hypothetical protein
MTDIHNTAVQIHLEAPAICGIKILVEPSISVALSA